MKHSKNTSNPGIQTYSKPQMSAQKFENCFKDFVVGWLVGLLEGGGERCVFVLVGFFWLVGCFGGFVWGV